VKGATTVAKEGKKNKTAEDPWAPVDGEAKVKKEKKDKGAASGKGGDYGLTAPSAGDLFNNRENADELLLLSVTEVVEGMVTSASKDPTDAIKADVVVLNKKNPADSRTYSDSLLFGRVLVGQLKPRVGTRVVGTLIEDVASKKQGQNAPWRLTAPSDDDIQVATKYLDSLNPLR
jgi:hypothetical protein